MLGTMRYASPPATIVGAILLATLTTAASAVDWLTLPSTYTHDAEGRRVTQYAQPAAAYAPQVSNFRSSGYTHTRSSIQFGQSADNYHRVEQWGDQVRPYGEWRFPYRPYSQPYPAWGPPYAGLGPIGGVFPGGVYPGAGFPGGGYPGAGFPGGVYPGTGGSNANPGNPYPPRPDGGYPVPPQYDGYYPSYPNRPRLNDQQFYRKPTQ